MLRKRFIQAAKAGICSKDVTRRALTRIRNEDGWSVMTSGLVLVAEKTDDPEGWINPLTLKAAEASVTRNGDDENLLVHQGKGDKEVCVTHTGIEGPFPNWESVVPGGKGSIEGDIDEYEFVGAFDADLLRKALLAFEANPSQPVHVFVKKLICTEDDACGVRATLAPWVLRCPKSKTLAVVMPCRVVE